MGEMLDELQRRLWWEIGLDDADRMIEIQGLKRQLDDGYKLLQDRFENKVELQRGDELPPGVLKMVKVFVAVKRKLQPGDKMAGRHGNKGVISRIAPRSRTCRISRTAHRPRSQPAGRAVADERRPDPRDPPGLGLRQSRPANRRAWSTSGRTALAGRRWRAGSSKSTVARPARRSVSYSDGELLELGDNLRRPACRSRRRCSTAPTRPTSSGCSRTPSCSPSGPVTLIDGRTGEAFDRPVTVGYIYMLKLGHLVDDKIHARSVGPYSLVTQQPLGGKAQFGGQRFGEMECWALQAYGASYSLQEMLTVKSDDVSGRTKIYEAIVRGEDTFEAGSRASTCVKELQALALVEPAGDGRRVIRRFRLCIAQRVHPRAWSRVPARLGSNTPRGGDREQVPMND